MPQRMLSKLQLWPVFLVLHLRLGKLVMTKLPNHYFVRRDFIANHLIKVKMRCHCREVFGV